jgi:hypothetical protein
MLAKFSISAQIALTQHSIQGWCLFVTTSKLVKGGRQEKHCAEHMPPFLFILDKTSSWDLLDKTGLLWSQFDISTCCSTCSVFEILLKFSMSLPGR